MSYPPTSLAGNVFLNTGHDVQRVYGPGQRNALDPTKAEIAKRDLASWPVYQPTPLLALPGLARRAGVAQVWLKHEGLRAPLASFKALGGAFALGEVLRDVVEASTGSRPAYSSLFAGKHAAAASGVHAVAATDGNHGRSLAWGAQVFGTPCTIFLPWNVSPEREALIAAFGAQIRRVPGNYDAAVAAAREASQAPGCVLIQDTSFEGYTLHCQRIMYGYMLMAQEIRAQLPPGDLPTHVFLQVGCGGLAAAVAADFWLTWGPRRPKVIAVQSTRAASLLRSLEAGARTTVEGDLDTAMIGIACGEISMLAWDILRDEVSLALAIDDEAAFEAMRLLAAGSDVGDAPVVIGETGAAGVGALLTLAADRSSNAGAAALDAHSRVLVIGSEGALDSGSYRRIVGADPGVVA